MWCSPTRASASTPRSLATTKARRARWACGRGSVVGTLIGALIMGVLQNGLNLMAVRPFYQQIAIGSVLILAVWLDRINSREGWRR
jgi:ABC-type xylose transport system permease subunit